VHLANSRRVNHFAAGVLLGYGICLPGFGRWQARTTGVRVLYFMRLKEWEFEINNANKSEEKGMLQFAFSSQNPVFFNPFAR